MKTAENTKTFSELYHDLAIKTEEYVTEKPVIEWKIFVRQLFHISYRESLLFRFNKNIDTLRSLENCDQTCIFYDTCTLCDMFTMPDKPNYKLFNFNKN